MQVQHTIAEFKMTYHHHTCTTLLLIQMQNISLRSLGMHRKQNFAFKVTQWSWLLLFAFSPSLFFCFSCLIFLVVFSLVGKVFKKAFRILGSDKRKGTCRWLVEQDFHGNFQVNVICLFSLFLCVLDWIVLILVWFERSLHPAQVSRYRGYYMAAWRYEILYLQAAM